MDDDIEEKDESSRSEERKERRQRKKMLLNDVRDQLEFYFSSANLRKDLFLQELLAASPYVELEVFKRFNKLRKLTTDISIMKKAIRKSSILELSEDGLGVRRNVPMEEKGNELECTIYVENLPPLVSHEWIRKVFGQYGTIDYVSLPCYKQTGRPKGFAFIEYHTTEEAQQAIVAFGGLASLDGSIKPGELLSIKTYGQEDNLQSASSVPPDNIKDSLDYEDSFKGTKRSHDEAFQEESQSESQTEKHSKKSKKKKRKRSKKEKEYEVDSIYLRVMSKKAWKELRNKYLDLQRQNMRQLKNLNVGLRELQSDGKEEKTSFEKGKKESPEFVNGLIVKMVLDEPPSDIIAYRKSLQNTYFSIAYVDIKDHETTVYIRFKSPDTAVDFTKHVKGKQVHVLEGVEEKMYWELILNSWQEKHQKKMDKEVMKGRHKIIKKSLKLTENSQRSHIVFDE